MKKILLLLLVSFFLIAPLFLTRQVAFAGQTGSQGGVPLEGTGRGGGAKPNPIDEQRKFAAAQMRYEREPPSGGEPGSSDAPTRSNLSLFSLIAALFGGVWTLLILLRHGFGKRLEQNRARSPRFWEFALKPSVFLTERKTNMKMHNLKFINAGTLLVAVAFLVVPLLLPAERVLAGDPNCQSGYIANPYNNNPAPRRPTQTEGQFAAAQIRNERSQPPRSRLKGGDSAMRSGFSFALSILVLLGGMWALLVLLRQRFGKNLEQKRHRLPKLLGFAFKPSFALSVFGLLFVAAIVGSVLTAPTAVTAEKREKPDKSKMTGLMNPSNKPVFKTAQQIGGDGATQMGSPVFDSAGNRYVRGGFTRTLTIGATTLTATRDFDLFVAKYAPDGTPLWARQGSGLTTGATNIPIEGATALAVDGSGNVYIGGSFVKTLTLQGGANASITLNDNGAAGVNYESFVAKYNSSGSLLWAKGGNSNSPKNPDNLETGQNAIDQLVFDQSGNPYVTGSVSGTNFLGSSFTNNGESEIVLARLNPLTGEIIWKQIIGGTKDDNGLDLKIDGANNLYLIGNFGSPSITFPNGDTFTNPDDPKGTLEDSTNTFIAKFNSSGSNLWVENLNNTETVAGSQIAVNAAGEIFLTGYYFDSATFPTVPETTLFETEGSGENEASLGGYVTKLDANGDFIWAKGFGGVGEAIALDATGRVHVVGTFWDGGTFGEDTANEDILASFGGEDLFVARYDSNGNFDWAKPIAASGFEGQIVISNPDPNGTTENNYNPLGIAYNPLRQTMFVSGDFQGAIALDCLTLTTPGNSLHSYLAELSGDTEPVSCRIWNGLDADDNNFDSPDNWNGGVLPVAGDSVYVPYTGNNFDAPDYNPATDIPLSNLTIADDRILTLGRNLTVNNRLDLFGGFIDAKNFSLLLGAAAQTFSINDGLVLGRVQKQFAVGSAGAFTFPVGTASSANSPEYSPVTLSNISGTGSFSVTANKGAYPNAASGLPANRAHRWWNLSNNGLTQTDLTFQYVAGDITQGTESQYRAYRIPTGGGAAAQVNSMINTTTKTVTAPAVTEFSDWTLAQPLAPTAAIVSIGGRIITTNGKPIARTTIVLTDSGGRQRSVVNNSFGYYRFNDIVAGETYIITCNAKRFTFEQPSRVLNVNDETMNVNFIGNLTSKLSDFR